MLSKNPSRQQSIRLPTVTTPPKFAAKKMRSKLFDDGDDDDSPQNEDPVELEVDKEYRRRSEYNRMREDLKRYEAEVKKGQIVEEEKDEEASEPEEEIGVDDVTVWMESLVKLRERDPQFLATGKTDGVKKKDRKKKEKKKKKMYLKDVQAQQLLEEGPDFVEEDEGGRRSRVQTYDEQQEELRRAVTDAVEAGGNDDDDEDLLKVKEGDDDESEEDDDGLKEIADEYFGKESELNEGDKFLRDYLLKQLWKEKAGKGKMEMIDEAEIQHIEEDEALVDMQEEYETQYRHEENAGEEVMGQSRVVEGSVRKKDNARKTQRKNKEDRMKIAEIERQEELKRLKNVKKKEMKEKMKKVLSIAGFKDGEECPLDAKDLDDEFDPEEYDKMMKAAFDDNYYGAEDDELRSDEDGDDDDEKPDFDKEDELLGLPKNWNVIQGGDGFTATREKVLKHKENGDGDDDEEQEEEEEVGEEEEEQRDGKRKRKRKASLVQRAKEALMEEYYKLDYEDTIGDLKTRFKFAKVQPNSYGLEKEEILFLDDTELNQYVPLKKMAPYMEKDWEVNKYKVKEHKLKFNELLERIDNPDDKRSKKRSKKKDGEQKRDVEEMKPAAPIVDEEGEAETSKLSRKAKRRRRQAEKNLPPNRMVAYGKTN